MTKRWSPSSAPWSSTPTMRSEEHTSELQSRRDLVCRLLLEKKKHVVRFNDRLITLIADHISPSRIVLFSFNDAATTEIYTLSLHDALPILVPARGRARARLDGRALLFGGDLLQPRSE